MGRSISVRRNGRLRQARVPALYPLSASLRAGSLVRTATAFAPVVAVSSSPEARQPSGSSLDSEIGEGSLGDGAKKGALLRSLPSIDSLLTQPSLEHLLADQPRPRKVAVLRRAVERARHRLLGGEERGLDEEDVVEALKEVSTPGLRRVLNGTGVVLHTNLGRAPLAGPAANRVLEIASGDSNLEYDVEEGERGIRIAPLIVLL